MGEGARNVSMVLSTAAFGCPHEVRSIHQTRSAGVWPGPGMGARAASASGRLGAAANPQNNSRGYCPASEAAGGERQRKSKRKRCEGTYSVRAGRAAGASPDGMNSSNLQRKPRSEEHTSELQSRLHLV